MQANTVYAALLLSLATVSPVRAQPAMAADDVDATPVYDYVIDWCTYPAGRPREAIPERGVVVVNEVEPNDTAATAQRILLGAGPGYDRDINVNGFVNPAADADFFQFTAKRGEIVGAALQGQVGLDCFLTIAQADGTVIITNDDDAGASAFYPATSPFPGGVANNDSFLTWMCPTTGTYLLRAGSLNGVSSGAYTLQIRLRPALLATNASGRQIIFLDFNGATIDAVTLFGGGNNPATLSGLSSFLTNWGLVAGDQNAVIDAIIAVVQENLNDLTAQNPLMSFELRNSRDHADPFGQSRVSRVIIGGTTGQLGISTIGIAEAIDPGNWGTEDTAVVLLDLLSNPATDPNSLNGVTRAPGVTMITLVGRGVGNVAAHELGHFIGSWHTNNGNATPNIMDQGGTGPAVQAGAGADGIFGNADDIDRDFAADNYAAEGIATGVEQTHLLSAFGLFFVPKLYVSEANNGFEDGSFDNPFNTVIEAVNAAIAGTETWIYVEDGNYPPPFTSGKRLQFQTTFGGTSLIGD